MDNHSTAYDILADLEAKLDKCTHKGDTLKARCPAHEDKTPSLDIKIGDNGDCVLVKCWAGCETDDVVKALGWEMRDLFASDSQRWESEPTNKRPRAGKKAKSDIRHTRILDPMKLPGAPETFSKGWGANDWDCPEGVDALEAIRGAASEIVHETNEALIEDTPLPSDVPGRVQAWIASLKDADLEGKRRILYLIKDAPEWQQLGADLRIVVVDAIKGQARSMATVILGRYDDRKMAWCDPPGKVEDTSDPGFKLVWDIEAQPDPRAVVPGLLYEGHQTVIEAGPKWGKTTLLIDAVASAYASGEWLGEACDEPGPILWISEMAEPLIRAWLARRLPEGVKPDIYVSPICSLNKLAAAVEEIHPSAVIVDSFIAAFRAERPNAGKPDEWRAGDVREFFTRLRDICPTSLTTNHVRKSDGAGRDSGDLHAAVDLIIELRDEDSKRHYTAPELNDRRRTLHYAGRIIHGRVTHCQMEDDFGFTVVDGHGAPSTGGGGGGADPFIPNAKTNQLDEKITGYLMANTEGVSQNAVQKAVGGRRPGMVKRLKVVGTLGTDGLWRCASGRKSPEPSQNTVSPEHGITPPEQVRPDSPAPPVGTRDAVGCVPVRPANGTQGGTQCVPTSHPIGDAPSGRTSGTHLGTHLAVPDLMPLALAKVTTAPTPRGGSDDGNASIDVLPIPAPEMHSIRADLDAQNYAPQDSELTPAESTPSADPLLDGEIEDGENTEQTDKTGAQNYAPTLDRSRPAPEVHSSGIKKWDDATSTWVDTLPGGDVFTVEGGIVHLSDRTTVTDGDPNIHWDMAWTDIELDREGMVH